MKKRFMQMVLVLGVLAIALCCTGCKKEIEPSTEPKIKFGTLTQQERKDYINDFLQQNYGITVTMDEVKQRQDSVFGLEDHYSVIARTADRDMLFIWVSKDGEITDTVYLLEMQPQITEYFSDIIERFIPEFKLHVFTNMEEIPSSKLTSEDDIQSYLAAEPAFSSIKVMVENDTEITDALMDELIQAFGVCAGRLRIGVCEDLESIDPDNFDRDLFVYDRSFRKPETDSTQP